MPSWYNEMKNLVGKQQILIQKNLRIFMTVKARCSVTHKIAIIIWFVFVLDLAMGVIHDFW